MATTVPEEKPTASSSEQKPTSYDPQILGQTAMPWIDYAIEQARVYQKTIEETIESTTEASKARVSQILSTSSAHFNQTIDTLQDLKSEYDAYEDILFGKIKEGVFVAASQPLVTGGVATGLGLLLLKRPRRFLYYKTLHFFASEESLLLRAEARVKELRQSLDALKTESEKLEKTATQAQEELIRGRTKLRQAGKQIQGVIRSAYKIERQAGGLKDILSDLPRREASRFRSQVSGLVSETRRERNAMTKEVTKISNYGISV